MAEQRGSTPGSLASTTKGRLSMSQYMFGIGHTKPLRKELKLIAIIEKEEECSFIETHVSGIGYQHWFTCQNLGEPFDRARAARVRKALDAAGLSHIGKRK